MLKLDILERSIMLGYVLGYNSETEAHVIYAMHLTDAVFSLVSAITDCYPDTCVMVLTGEDRAKAISHSPKWLTALSDIGAII